MRHASRFPLRGAEPLLLDLLDRPEAFVDALPPLLDAWHHARLIEQLDPRGLARWPQGVASEAEARRVEAMVGA